MPSTITITLDEKGNSKVSVLPQGVFYSRFATLRSAEAKDVISINAAGDYLIEVKTAWQVEDASSTRPVRTLPWGPFQASFSVNAVLLPISQKYGTASCKVGGVEYTFGVIVNPSVVLIPATIDRDGKVLVDADSLPVGVDFELGANEFNVWAAGGYTFAFSLLPEHEWQFRKVTFTKDAPMVTSQISADNLTAWVYNDYLATNLGATAKFDFDVSDPVQGNRKIIDPTIINNPINQGGSGGFWYEREPRRELVGALAH